ncbi:extensin family protein [Sphingomonas oleivorans]|uniref:extensin-like domain-containing protein n=1 Tax=Sphingomonas oleivorans TaxID=1735121 RepID=UPI003C6ED6B6
MPVVRIIFIAALLAAGFILFAIGRRSPQDLPWTRLDLGAPIGLFTGRKVATLTENAPLCRALLDRAGVRYMTLTPRAEGAHCGHSDAVRFTAGGSRRIAYAPRPPGTSCAVAAALAMWEWNVVQPAALRHLGRTVTRIEHLGSYNCRRIYGRENGNWSEHSRANAIDITGFRLDDGHHVTILKGWDGAPEEAAFLREVRDGACKLFSTTLSPDYNAAHADHLHLDEAKRGIAGWRTCR